MHRDCDVIFAIFEHILSYKLSELQRLVDSRIKKTQNMIEFQSWLARTCRDVFDESNFILMIKTQLIYSNDSQTFVDEHSYRWKIAQMLLTFVKNYFSKFQRDFSQSIEMIKKLHEFFMMCFLHTNVEEVLHD